jgi:hypothetical protein
MLTAPVLTSIYMPANTAMEVNENEQFNARGTFSNSANQDITADVTWASSDTATASNSADAGRAPGVCCRHIDDYGDVVSITRTGTLRDRRQSDTHFDHSYTIQPDS